MNRLLLGIGVKVLLPYLLRGEMPLRQLLDRPTVQYRVLSDKDEALLNVRGKLGAVIVLLGTRDMGKCISADTPICLENGKIIPVDECRVGDTILSLCSDFKIRPTTIMATANLGIQECLRFTFSSGKTITVTPEHPFLTVIGWKRAELLSTGDRVALARTIRVTHTKDVPYYKMKVLAYLLGDGSLVEKTPMFTSTNPLLGDDFIQAACQFPNIEVSLYNYPGRAQDYSVKAATKWRNAVFDTSGLDYKNPDTLRYLYWDRGFSLNEMARSFGIRCSSMREWFVKFNIPRRPKSETRTSYMGNSVVDFLKECGILGLKSTAKFIPSIVFDAPLDSIAVFLNRLYSTDGGVSGQYISFYSTSEVMIDQVQHLLLRFSIFSKKRKKLTSYCGKRFVSYALSIEGKNHLMSFIDQIGIYGKEDKLESLKAELSQIKPNPSADTIPSEVWDTIEFAHSRWGNGHHWTDIGYALGYSRPKEAIGSAAYSPSRDKMRVVATVTGDERIANLADSDIFWDKIKSIEPVRAEVCDLMTMEQNFIANDIVVHNTELAYRLAEFIGKPTYAVSPEQIPPPWIERITLPEVRRKVRKGSTIIMDDLPAYASNRDYNNSLIENLEKLIPMVRHQKRLHLIFSSQSAAQADKYILDCELAFFKPLGLLKDDMERPHIRQIYTKYVDPVFDNKTDSWIQRHAFMWSRRYKGLIDIKRAVNSPMSPPRPIDDSDYEEPEEEE